MVDSNGVIVVGHTRWKAAQKLKLTEVPVHVATDLTPEQLRAYRAVLGRSGASLRSRVVALAAQRTLEGYMAEVVDDDDGYLLLEHHCPICDAAKTCLGFCSAELRLFAEALGDDVTVERTEHLLADGRRCTYRIRAR